MLDNQQATAGNRVLEFGEHLSVDELFSVRTFHDKNVDAFPGEAWCRYSRDGVALTIYIISRAREHWQNCGKLRHLGIAIGEDFPRSSLLIAAQKATGISDSDEKKSSPWFTTPGDPSSTIRFDERDPTANDAWALPFIPGKTRPPKIVVFHERKENLAQASSVSCIVVPNCCTAYLEQDDLSGKKTPASPCFSVGVKTPGETNLQRTRVPAGKDGVSAAGSAQRHLAGASGHRAATQGLAQASHRRGGGGGGNRKTRKGSDADRRTGSSPRSR